MNLALKRLILYIGVYLIVYVASSYLVSRSMDIVDLITGLKVIFIYSVLMFGSYHIADFVSKKVFPNV